MAWLKKKSYYTDLLDEEVATLPPVAPAPEPLPPPPPEAVDPPPVEEEAPAAEEPEEEPVYEGRTRDDDPVSIRAREYKFISELIRLLTTAKVPTREITDIVTSSPFKTIGDVNEVAVRLWQLATQKYQLPKSWLIENLP